MNAPGYLRVWRGWKRDDVGDSAFIDGLRSPFVPATWQVMQHYGLMCYVPSALQGGDGALPNEVALLFYTSKDDYESHKAVWIGKRYSSMHSELFRFGDAGKPNSTSAEGQPPDSPPTQAPAKPPAWWRRNSDAGQMLWANTAPAAFVALTPGPANKDPTPWFAALGHTADEAIVFLDRAFVLVWLAGAGAAEPMALAHRLAGSLGGTVVCAHAVNAQPLPPEIFSKYEGANIDWGQTLRFAPGAA
jgi:hypothetical protein